MTRNVSRKRLVTTIVLILVGALFVAGVVIPTILVHRRDEAAEEKNGGVPPRLHQAAGEVAVVLDSVALGRADIATQELRSGNTAGAVRLTGELVADPARMTTIRAGLAGRLTSPDDRWPSLGEYVTAGTVLGQVSDARPFSAPGSGTVTWVGAQPGEFVQAGQELLRLADPTAAIARLVWLPGVPAPSLVTVAPLGQPLAAAARARLIGALTDVDTLTRLPVYLYRLAHVWQGARAGAAVEAFVPDSGHDTNGLFVPIDAVVQWQGLAWLFVERGRGRFVRIRVDTSHPVPGGWIVPSPSAGPMMKGDRVVVRGAAQLLSEEFRSRLPEGEADEDD